MKSKVFFRPEIDHKFDDFSVYIRSFIQIDETLSKDFFENQISKLNDLFMKYMCKTQSLREPKERDFMPQTKNIGNDVIYGFKKLYIKKVKLFRFNEYFYSQAALIISMIVTHMKEASSQKHDKFCSLEALEICLETERNSSKFYIKEKKRAKRLRSYINARKNCPIYPDIPMNQFQASLNESARKVDMLIEYSAHDSFDDFLYYFIKCNGGFDEFDLAVKNALKFSPEKNGNNSIVFYEFKNAIMSNFFKLLNIQNQKQEIVVRSALIRFFFDRFYRINFNIFLGNEQISTSFKEACKILMKMTPKEMQINSSMVKPEMMDIPFVNILEKSDFLKKALVELNLLPFFTSPIDILAHIFRALKLCELFAGKNSLENKQKRKVEDDEISQIQSQTSSMSFDDFFPLFCLLFAVSPPENCFAISEFLNMIVGMNLSPQFDFSQLFFISAVEYIDKMVINELTPS